MPLRNLGATHILFIGFGADFFSSDRTASGSLLCQVPHIRANGLAHKISPNSGPPTELSTLIRIGSTRLTRFFDIEDSLFHTMHSKCEK